MLNLLHSAPPPATCTTHLSNNGCLRWVLECGRGGYGGMCEGLLKFNKMQIRMQKPVSQTCAHMPRPVFPLCGDGLPMCVSAPSIASVPQTLMSWVLSPNTQKQRACIMCSWSRKDALERLPPPNCGNGASGDELAPRQKFSLWIQQNTFYV